MSLIRRSKYKHQTIKPRDRVQLAAAVWCDGLMVKEGPVHPICYRTRSNWGMLQMDHQRGWNPGRC